MSHRSAFVRSVWFCLSIAASGAPAAAQEPHVHQHPAPQPPPPADHSAHQEHGTAGVFAPRDASGTAWLPDETPMYGIHATAGAWQVMWHGNAFAQYLHETGERGSRQAGSINWIMGMARRDLGAGRLGLRGMFSLEPLTIAGCGYPDLLASGETCDGAPIHDRQHPHDFFMELAGEYDRPLAGPLRLQLYGGLAGEPALGPVAYPHRISAMPNPLAPISHHWLDATHITFGVITAGISERRWKAEASIFNGREPDEQRWNLDFAPLDSISGRLWFAPTPSLVLQVSAGRLAEAEAQHESEGRVDVARVTASATYHRPLREGTLWATTIAWGRNEEAGQASHAFLMESALTVNERDVWFGRFEIGGKPAHDLDIHGSDALFTVAKLQGGYTRYLPARAGLQPGFGGGLTLGIVPKALREVYGRRVNPGVALFVTLRPAVHRM